MSRRQRIAAMTAVAVSALTGIGPVLAESYPARPVRIITGAAGIFHDIVARDLAKRLSERWQQGVIVENHPAAGLTIGTGIAAKAPPDGYTLLLADRTSLAAAPSLYKNLRYDPLKDFRPITLVARAPAIVAVHPSIPVANLKEFIDYAKQQRDPILFASAGNATFPHLTGLLFAELAGVRIQPVQFRGGGEAATALLGGHAKFAILSIPTILPQVNAGQAKALAVTSAHRIASSPDIPTAAEAGLAGLEAAHWVAMLVPAGTPDEIADRIHRDVVEILRSPDMRDRLRAQGAEAVPGARAELAAFMTNEAQILKKLIERAGLRMD